MLRATFQHIEAAPELSWKWFRWRNPHFDFCWHFHREYELTLITEGSGSRFVGDSIEEYRPGDLTLIGPNLPHAYASAGDSTDHEAVVAHFRDDFLGVDWFRRPEFAAVADLLRRSRRGLTFAGDTPAQIIADLAGLPPAEQTISLLTTLVRLARHPDARPLASTHYSPVLSRAAGDRIDAIIRTLHAEYTQQVSLAGVSQVAHLSKAATSRFFRRTTGSTITAYLNTLRVDAACRLLVGTDRQIADIAGSCGYQNLSHFNRRFHALKGMSPRQYRARFGPVDAGTERPVRAG